MEAAGDPFESLRAKYKRSNIPIDKQTDDEKASTYEEIRQLYEGIETHSEFVELQELKEEWVKVLVAALMREPRFWALCLDNAVGLYAVKPPRVVLSKDWAVGIYLREFYHFYDNFDDGFNELMAEFEDQITTSAEHHITTLLQDFDSELEGVPAPKVGSRPIARLEPAVVSLCMLVRQEKDAVLSKSQLASSLRALGPLLRDLPKTSERLGVYSGQAQEEGIVDRTGKYCLKTLRRQMEDYELAGMQALPPLSDADLDLLKQATSTDYVKKKPVSANAGYTEATSGEPVDEQTSSKKKKRTWTKRHADEEFASAMAVDPPVQFEWLSERFQRVSPPITYPCFAPPTDAFTVEHVKITALDSLPGFRVTQAVNLQIQNQEPKSKNETKMKKLWRRSSAVVKARMISEKELEEPAPDIDGLMKQCAALARSSIEGMAQNLFEQTYRGFAETTMRSRDALELSGESSTWQTYSDLLLQDNWFHVRRLLQALEHFTELALDEVERDMAGILTATRGASDNPIFFMITMDHVLACLWRRLLKQEDDRSSAASGGSKLKTKLETQPSVVKKNWIIVKNVFEELATFAQGAVISAAVLRFKTSSLFKRRKNAAGIKKPEVEETNRRYLDWYEILYLFDPRCANTNCNELLPDPAKFDTMEYIKEIFSVGTRDARVGKRTVRQFISDRADCYPCFFSCVTTRSATPMLVVILFYYSHLFHAVEAGCKTARGKRAFPGIP